MSRAAQVLLAHCVGRGRLLAVGMAVMLAGCASVGPEYQAPQVATPARWSLSTDAQSADRAALPEWWREFHDSVLDALVEDALAANLDLAGARARLREARARRELAGAQLGPAVDASASAARSKSSAQSGSGTTRELYSAGFDASWELDVFGGLRRGAEAAQADLEASVEDLRDTRVSLLAEVVLNYVDLRTAESRLAKAEANLRSSSETYDLARWRNQAGLVSALDVAQARTELESVRASLPALHTAIAGAQNRLAVLLGVAPGELKTRLSPTAAIPLADRSIAVGIPADILRQRPDVRAAERRLAAQTARLGEAEAARYPSFRLSGSLGLEALTLGGLADGAQTRSLLAGITAPIFDAGRIRANIGIQDALLEQARLSYRAAVMNALEEVENALVAVNNTDQRRGRLARAVDSAHEALQIAEYQYASGLADFLNVLNSQRTLLSLEDQLANSTGELASAQIQLYKALGGGWKPAPTPDTQRTTR
jgi:NodT family efflux transporter outer membrane factor (OMF) lipoprotein